MRVVDILGWHIQLYHSHLIVTPPLPAGHQPRQPRLGWHQDSGRLNLALDGEPRPRVSLTVGLFFFPMRSCRTRGNFHVGPGSHRRNQLNLPADDRMEHPDATPVCVGAGAKVANLPLRPTNAGRCGWLGVRTKPSRVSKRASMLPSTGISFLVSLALIMPPLSRVALLPRPGCVPGQVRTL